MTKTQYVWFDMIVCQEHDICWYVQMTKTSYVRIDKFVKQKTKSEHDMFVDMLKRYVCLHDRMSKARYVCRHASMT